MPANNYLTVARVASSDGRRTYDIKTDGHRLTCPCPGWTRRVQADGTRTCRHVREIEPLVSAYGGISRVVEAIRAGRHSVESASMPVSSTVRVETLPNAPSPQAIREALTRSFSTTPPRARAARTMDAIRVAAEDVTREYFGGNGRPSRGHLALVDAIERAIRRFAGSGADVAPPPTAVPDWIGGGRAIILRD